MSSSPICSVHVEIEKHSNEKREYDTNECAFVLDRILPYPYFYPYAYGYFSGTLGNDGDELDALIITNKHYRIDDIVDCRIVGGLSMEDEKGMDEKIFVVPLHDTEYETMTRAEKEEVHENISWFFTNYKNKTKGRWSKVHGFLGQDTAISLYNESIQKHANK
jgi:inorganic pyrophosphatase